jgi:hypothetical protein
MGYKLGHIISSETEIVSASLYKKEDDIHTVWLKVGVALLEIPERYLGTTIDTLIEMYEYIEEPTETGEESSADEQ